MDEEEPRPVRVNNPNQLFRSVFHGSGYLAGVRYLYNEQIASQPSDDDVSSTIKSVSTVRSMRQGIILPDYSKLKYEVSYLLIYLVLKKYS